MKKQFAILTLLGCLVAMVCFLGCEVQKPQQITQTTKQATATKSRSVEIPLDDAQGVVSTTRNFYFVIDGSGSMNDRPGGACKGDQSHANKLAGAKWAVGQFMDNMPADVNLGLYVFDSNGQREVVPLGSNNRRAFMDAVDDVSGGGGTPLADAIRAGTNKLVTQYKKQLGYGSYRLVVVTDGDASGIPGAAKYATKKGVPIYTIGLCIGNNHPLRDHSVSYQAADNFDDLAQALQETMAETQTFDATEFK
jgi:Ca-activated chloride channel homolog